MRLNILVNIKLTNMDSENEFQRIVSQINEVLDYDQFQALNNEVQERLAYAPETIYYFIYDFICVKTMKTMTSDLTQSYKYFDLVYNILVSCNFSEALTDEQKLTGINLIMNSVFRKLTEYTLRCYPPYSEEIACKIYLGLKVCIRRYPVLMERISVLERLYFFSGENTIFDNITNRINIAIDDYLVRLDKPLLDETNPIIKTVLLFA